MTAIEFENIRKQYLLGLLAYSALCEAGLCYVGMLMFKRKERTFIDTI